MKMNPSKIKAVRFTRPRLKVPLNYSIMGTIPEASSSKYLRIILRSDLSWADHVNYTVVVNDRGRGTLLYNWKF